jgi:hypothetical protein
MAFLPLPRLPGFLPLSRSKAPLKELAARYGLNHKTVAKWRKGAFVNDAPMGPKTPHSTVLSCLSSGGNAAVPAKSVQEFLTLPERKSGKGSCVSAETLRCT